MEEVFNAFGLDAKLIVIQIVNFSILLLALWYFLYTPILNIINERHKKIEQGVQDAENAREKLSRAEEEQQEIITNAHSKADAIVAKSKDHAELKGSEILHEAQEKSERVIEDARQKADVLKQEAQKESEEAVAKMAVLAAEKVLRERK